MQPAGVVGVNSCKTWLIIDTQYEPIRTGVCQGYRWVNLVQEIQIGTVYCSKYQYPVYIFQECDRSMRMEWFVESLRVGLAGDGGKRYRVSASRGTGFLPAVRRWGSVDARGIPAVHVGILRTGDGPQRMEGGWRFAISIHA